MVVHHAAGRHSSPGARAFCAVRSYLQTAAKHSIGQLDELTGLFNGQPWMPPPTVAGPEPVEA